MEMLGELLGEGFVSWGRRTVQPEERSGLR